MRSAASPGCVVRDVVARKRKAPLRACLVLTVLIAALTLIGCGGGGSGSGGGGAPAPTAPISTSEKDALALTAENHGEVLTFSVAYAEFVLALAHTALERLREVRRDGAAGARLCSPFGGIGITHDDVDADRTLSPGDLVLIDFGACPISVLGFAPVGQMLLRLEAPADPSVEFVARLDLERGLALYEIDGVRVSVLGSMKLESRLEQLSHELRVLPSEANDLRLMLSDDREHAIEAIVLPDLRKTHRYDLARTLISLRYSLESMVLDGRVDVETPTPLSAYFDTYPDDGAVVVQGAAGSSLVLRVQGHDTESLRVDAAGTGQERLRVPWNLITSGFYWWRYGPAGTGQSGNRFGTMFYGTAALVLLEPTLPLTELGVNPTIRLQFNRPLAPDSSSLDFAFAEVVPPGTMMGATVEADVQLHGALLIIRPKTQLRHGQEYSFGGAEFRDANGSRYTLMKQTFRTPATLSARIDPATPRLLAGNAPLVLDGRGSQAIGSTVVAHRWRQVSGPPVTFGSSTAPTTSVALAGGSGSGMVTVELEVVNAEGEFATGRLQLGAVADPTQPHVWMTGGASPRLLTDADGVIASALRTSPANGVTVAASSPGSMTLIQLWTGSRPVAVGAYEDAIAGPGLPGTDQNGIQITGCAFLGGRFDILEIETDAQGALVRFAADVEQQCSSIGGAQTIMTAVRINSAAPVLR